MPLRLAFDALTGRIERLELEYFRRGPARFHGIPTSIRRAVVGMKAEVETRNTPLRSYREPR